MIFTAHDKDASGDLSVTELGHVEAESDMTPKHELMESSEPN